MGKSLNICFLTSHARSAGRRQDPPSSDAFRLPTTDATSTSLYTFDTDVIRTMETLTTRSPASGLLGRVSPVIASPVVPAMESDMLAARVWAAYGVTSVTRQGLVVKEYS